MKKLSALTCFLSFALVMTVSSAHAAKRFKYIEEKVDQGGSISGTVTFQGQTPAPVEVNLNTQLNADFCTKHAGADKDGILNLQHVEVDNGKLKDAVIFIKNMEKGKPWPEIRLNIDFKNCKAAPKVAVVRQTPRGTTKGLVTVKNHDEGVLHNPKGYSIRTGFRKIFFKKWLLNKGAEADVTKTLKLLRKDEDTHLYVECEQHLWMTTSSRVVWNPYYAISNQKGSFEIEDIPPGRYQVVVWHPYVGEKVHEISVSAGKETKIDFKLGSN